MTTWERLDRELLRRALQLPGPTLDTLTPRRAAVAIALGESDTGVSLLLIRRAERASDPWSGHMALPGGHAEPNDENLFATVVRETREELGIDLARTAEYLGELEDFLPVTASRVSVRPFVFALTSHPLLTPNAEVAETLWLPVPEMISGALAAEHELILGDQRHRFPAFRAGEARIWGLTYRVLTTLFSRVEVASKSTSAPRV